MSEVEIHKLFHEISNDLNGLYIQLQLLQNQNQKLVPQVQKYRQAINKINLLRTLYYERVRDERVRDTHEELKDSPKGARVDTQTIPPPSS